MKIAILGAGGIGLGMAALLSERHFDVSVWAPSMEGAQPLLEGNRRLPAETIAYLGKVGRASQSMSLTAQSAASPPLFVVRRTVAEVPSPLTASDPQASLFAVRKVGP